MLAGRLVDVCEVLTASFNALQVVVKVIPLTLAVIDLLAMDVFPSGIQCTGHTTSPAEHPLVNTCVLYVLVSIRQL